MSTLTIKAPAVIQVYRLFFACCALYFSSQLLHLPFPTPAFGFLALGFFTFCNLVGFAQTWVRTPQSRLALVSLGLFVPGIMLVGISFKFWGAWRAWLTAAIILFSFSIVPLICAVVVFGDKKTNDYFSISET